MQAILQSQQNTISADTAAINAQAQANATKAQMAGNMLNAGGGLLQGLVTMSDERQKTSVAPAEKQVSEMLDKLSPFAYRYKDESLPGTAPGQRFGIMAQDLERSAAGKSAVRETEHGKMIDVGQGLGVALAALSTLHRRLKAVEGRSAR